MYLEITGQARSLLEDVLTPRTTRPR